MDVVLVGEGIPFVGNPYDLTFVRIVLALRIAFCNTFDFLCVLIHI